MDKYNLDSVINDKNFSLKEILDLLDDVKKCKHQVQVNQNIRSFFKVQYDNLLTQIKQGEGQQTSNITLLIKYANLAGIEIEYSTDELERFYKIKSCIKYYNEAVHYLHSPMKNVGVNVLKSAMELQKELNIKDSELNICHLKLEDVRTLIPTARIKDIISRASTYGNKKNEIEKLVNEGTQIARFFNIDLSNIKINNISLLEIETSLKATA